MIGKGPPGTIITYAPIWHAAPVIMARVSVALRGVGRTRRITQDQDLWQQDVNVSTHRREARKTADGPCQIQDDR